jgi:hypothetical protein
MSKFMLLALALALSCAVADSHQSVVDSESCESPQVVSAVSAIYPPFALKVHLLGLVQVRIDVNEKGEVIAANPSGGNDVFLAASKSAALRWRFQPTGKHETGRLVFKYVLFGSDNDPRDAGDAFFPPCKVEVRRSLPHTQTIY